MSYLFKECTAQELAVVLQSKGYNYVMELIEDLDQSVTLYYDNPDCNKPFAKVLSYEIYDEEDSYGINTVYYTLTENGER
jgi:hypothetical protein